jgi:hypothetical protein
MNERLRKLERRATETVRCGLNGTSTAESFNRKKFAEIRRVDCERLFQHCSELYEPLA